MLALHRSFHDSDDTFLQVLDVPSQSPRLPTWQKMWFPGAYHFSLGRQEGESKRSVSRYEDTFCYFRCLSVRGREVQWGVSLWLYFLCCKLHFHNYKCSYIYNGKKNKSKINQNGMSPQIQKKKGGKKPKECCVQSDWPELYCAGFSSSSLTSCVLPFSLKANRGTFLFSSSSSFSISSPSPSWRDSLFAIGTSMTSSKASVTAPFSLSWAATLEWRNESQITNRSSFSD